jgi:hypothetical protein
LGKSLLDMLKHALLECIKARAFTMVWALWIAAFPTTTVFEADFALSLDIVVV